MLPCSNISQPLPNGTEHNDGTLISAKQLKTAYIPFKYTNFSFDLEQQPSIFHFSIWSADSEHAVQPYHSVLVLAGCSAEWLKVELRGGYEAQSEFSDVTAVVVEARYWKKEPC